MVGSFKHPDYLQTYLSFNRIMIPESGSPIRICSRHLVADRKVVLKAAGCCFKTHNLCVQEFEHLAELCDFHSLWFETTKQLVFFFVRIPRLSPAAAVAPEAGGSKSKRGARSLMVSIGVNGRSSILVVNCLIYPE